VSFGRAAALRTVIAIAVIVALFPASAAAGPHRADGRLSDWRGTATMLSGESRVSKGELIYDDWLYDDYGADLDNAPNPPVFRAAFAPTRGDYRYPTDSARYGYNAADLRQLRVSASGAGLHIAAFLQTMKQRDAAAVTIGIDTGRAREGSGWPHGAGIDSPAADTFITFWGTGGWITDRRGRNERLRRQAVNLAENAIEVDVPWRSIPYVRGRTVTLYAITGLADPPARAYKQVPLGQASATQPGGGQPGSTAVFDAAFDPQEEWTRAVGSHWGEGRQSRALAGRSLSGLGHRVRIADLEGGVTGSHSPVPGRFYNRIFRSTQNFGEGIVLKQSAGPEPGGSPDPQFLSPHQPYGLYLPDDYVASQPAPLFLNGHSLDVNHNEYQALSPNLYNQLGDERSSIVITPLARGMDTWYIDSAFKDVLEAWEDLRANYSVDDERTSIGGYSMGGYMTYRMGLLMPDRFAAANPYVGPPAYQLWAPPLPPQPPGDYDVAGQTNNIVANGLNLPFEINNGGLDELVPAAGPTQQAQSFRDAGNPHLYYFYPESDHFALLLADTWGHTRDFLDQHPVRNLSPDEVRYKRYPSMDLPQHGLRFDGAYWVDGMTVRTPGDTCSPGQAACESASGQVDAYTLGHGRARGTTQPVTTAFPGPPFPATVQGTTRQPGGPIADQNRFEATFTNLRATAFETTRMGLDPASALTASLTAATGPGAFALTLRGNFPPVTATLDGQPVAVQQTAGAITLNLNLTTGSHALAVTP
jgi:dienelactone hydrolase